MGTAQGMTDLAKLVERLNLLADAFFVEGSCGRDEQYHNIAHTHQQWLTIAHGIREAAAALEHLAGGSNSLSTEALAQLKADAARYRWLREHCEDALVRAGTPYVAQYCTIEKGTKARIDAAIDEALREGHATEGNHDD